MRGLKLLRSSGTKASVTSSDAGVFILNVSTSYAVSDRSRASRRSRWWPALPASEAPVVAYRDEGGGRDVNGE